MPKNAREVSPYYMIDSEVGDYVGFETLEAAIERAEQLLEGVDIHSRDQHGNIIVRVGVEKVLDV